MTYRAPEPLSGETLSGETLRGESAAGEQHWEQPSFSATAQQAPTWAAQAPTWAAPAPAWDGRVQAWGEVVPAPAAVVVAPPSPREESLRTLRRLIFPVALVLAIVTGDWLPVLVLALVLNAVLKRQLAYARVRRVQLSADLR